MYLNPATPAVARRQKVEVKIIKSLIAELLIADLKLAIFDGEDTYGPFDNEDEILQAIYNTDEDFIHVYQNNQQMGWIRLIYGNGNDGWDVMSDWTTNLDALIPKTLTMIQKEGA